MASFYSVIRYVPDPVRDERINIGVVVYGDDGSVRTKFTQRWRRLQGFGAEDTGYLRKFVEEIGSRAVMLPGFSSAKTWDRSEIESAIGSWKKSIQFSEARASMKTADALLVEVFNQFVREEHASRPRARDRRSAIAIGVAQLRAAIGGRFELDVVEKLIKRTSLVPGKHELHQFDIVVENGHLITAAQGISFEAHDSGEIGKDVDSVIWSIDDVKKKMPSTPAAVIVLPPRHSSKQFDRLQKLSHGLDFTIVKESGVTRWAGKVADQITLQH